MRNKNLKINFIWKNEIIAAIMLVEYSFKMYNSDEIDSFFDGGKRNGKSTL